MNNLTHDMHSKFCIQRKHSSLQERIVVVAFVALLHLSAFAAYWMQPEMPRVLVNEMSVSFANMQMHQDDVVPVPKSKLHVIEPVPADVPVAKEESPPALPDATPTSPVVLDAEPDYKAGYLNNPRPPYPLIARRMGYYGKVILEVEILAGGIAGEVKLHETSGFDILDNSAIQTVKTWRFTPARRFGQAVTQRFLIPIQFSLENSAA